MEEKVESRLDKYLKLAKDQRKKAKMSDNLKIDHCGKVEASVKGAEFMLPGDFIKIMKQLPANAEIQTIHYAPSPYHDGSLSVNLSITYQVKSKIINTTPDETILG